MGCHSSKLSSPVVISDTKVSAKLIAAYEEACQLLQEFGFLGTLPKLKEVVLTNQKLLFLAEEYFKNTVAAVKLLAATKLCLSKAKSSHGLILDAMKCYDKEAKEHFDKRSPAIAKLKEFMEAGSTDIRTKVFASVCERQRSMYQEIGVVKNEIEEKLSSIGWRKAWRLTRSTAVWSHRSGALEGEKDVVMAMWKRRFEVHELDSVRAMMKRFEIQMGSVSANAEFALRYEEEVALAFAVKEIKSKVGGVEESLLGLETKVDACFDEIGRALAEFLTVITREI